MAKSNLLIALLVIFILPVFIGSYTKYSHLSYEDMNYTQIGEEYTDYFSEGMEEISVISDIGEISIKVMDYITDAIDWITEAMKNIIEFFRDLFNKISGGLTFSFKDGLQWKNDTNNGGYIEAPDNELILPDYGFSGTI